MDRKMVVDLIRNKMVQCPMGRQRIWLTRCFEITVRSDQVAEVDEYETYGNGNGAEVRNGKSGGAKNRAGMLHVGRSIVSLKDGRVIEEGKRGRS